MPLGVEEVRAEDVVAGIVGCADRDRLDSRGAGECGASPFRSSVASACSKRARLIESPRKADGEAEA
jgi:hypothetical protein